jgi:hypothetical protein
MPDALGEHLVATDLRLENGIRLIGYALMLDGQTIAPPERAVASPGQDLRLTLVWSNDAHLDESYTVFVQLLSRDGVLIAQHDGIPVRGTRPTSGWQVGERFIDPHPITLPQTDLQDSVLIVGLYQSETVERLDWEGGDDFISLLSLQMP